MTQIPLSLVIALIAIGTAEWPNVGVWSELSVVHHALVHGLFLLSGALIGFQTAWWTRAEREAPFASSEDQEVIS